MIPSKPGVAFIEFETEMQASRGRAVCLSACT